MQPTFPTIILRHRKENLKKCSLRGLESHKTLSFFTYPTDSLPDLTNYLLLTLDAPLLSSNDTKNGLFLIDATWRYAEKIERQLIPSFPSPMRRSLPKQFRTAYPRRQEDCPDPTIGLASVEALYVAHTILGYSTEGLLDHYHWKEDFLEKNAASLTKITH